MCLLFLRLVSLDLLLFTSEFYGYLCPPPPTKVRVGGHIGFSVDPVSIGIGVTNSCTHDIS